MKKHLVFFLFLSNMLISQNEVVVTSKMSNVMWKGELSGKIDTGSLTAENTYGIGPIEYLRGEILVFDGETFISYVNENEELQVEKKESKAPFFVHKVADKFKEFNTPKNVIDLKSLEGFIDKKYKNLNTPFMFIVKGTWDTMDVHSVNLAEGKSVSNPREAHEGMKNFIYENIEGYIVGFFSRKHQTIFTHHDTFIHCHFISKDKSVMGHVDSFSNSKKLKIKVSK
jgi:acetolactate decarboxylase